MKVNKKRETMEKLRLKKQAKNNKRRILVTIILLMTVKKSYETSFGFHTIPTNPNKCDTTPTTYSRSDIVSRYADLDKLFGYSRTTSLEYLQTKDADKLKSLSWSTLWRTLPIGLLFVIGCIAVLVVIIDLIMRMTGGRLIGAATYPKQARMVIYFSTIAVALFTLLFAILWIIWALKTKEGMLRSLCAADRMSFELINGVNDDREVFPGTLGYRVLFGTIKQEIVNLNQVQDIQSILDLGSNVKAQNLEKSLENFFKEFGARSVESCSGSERRIRPDLILDLHPFINDNIEKESSELIGTAKKLHEGATIVDYLMNRGCDRKYTLTMNKLMGKMNQFETGLEKTIEAVPPIVDYPQKTEAISWFMWITVILLMIITSLFLTFLSINYLCDSSKKAAVVIQGVTTIILFALGILVSFMSIRSAFYAHTQMGLCYHAYEGFTDRSRVGEIVDKDMMPILDTCFYEGSAEDVSKSLSFTFQGHFQEVESIIDGFGFEPNNLNLSSQEPPSYADYLEEKLKKVQSYSQDNFASSPADGPNLQLERMNPISACVKNEFQVDEEKCQLRPVSTLEDDEKLNNSTNFCIVFSKFNHDSISNRYSTLEGECALQATYIYANVKQCVNEHDVLVSDMISKFEQDPMVNVKEVTQAIQDSRQFLTEPQKLLQNSLSFVSSSRKDDKKSLKGMKNCTAIKQYVYNAYGNHCYDFVHTWAKQTIYMLVFSCFLMIYAFLAWCTVIRNSGEDGLDLDALNVDTTDLFSVGGKQKQGKIILVSEKILTEKESAMNKKKSHLVDATSRKTPLTFLDKDGVADMSELAQQLEKKVKKKEKVMFRRPKMEEDYEEEDEEDEEDTHQVQNLKMEDLKRAAQQEARERKRQKMKQEQLKKKQKLIELARKKKQLALMKKKEIEMQKQKKMKQQRRQRRPQESEEEDESDSGEEDSDEDLDDGYEDDE